MTKNNEALDQSKPNQSHIDLKKFYKGVSLPYETLDIHNIPDGAKQDHFIEIHCGGFGSEISPHPTQKYQFYALTDRGPNTTYDVNGDKGKIFLDPSYTPKIRLFELQLDGSIKKLKEILLKDPTGRAITGLPNRHFGATKEVAYDQNGVVLAVGTDEYGLDSEGLIALKDGTFWVSDEYGPHLVNFNGEGLEIDRINAYKQDARCKSGYFLQNEFANRKQNWGMEGLTISPDQKKLVGIMQSTMSNPDSSVTTSDLVRIVVVNLDDGSIAQYLYRQELRSNSNTAIVALSETCFLVAERDDDFYKDNPNAFKRIYKIYLDAAINLEKVQLSDHFQQNESLGLLIDGQTLEQYLLNDGWEALKKLNILPVAKSLVVDLVETLHYPHDKVEGLWVIDEQHLAIINDDDYGFTETDGILEQKYLDAEKSVIDCNTLYVIGQLNLAP